MSVITPVEKAYLASFLENKAKISYRRTTLDRELVISFSIRHEPVLDFLRDKCEGIVSRYTRSATWSKPCAQHCKTKHRHTGVYNSTILKLTGTRATIVLYNLQRFMLCPEESQAFLDFGLRRLSEETTPSNTTTRRKIMEDLRERGWDIP